jgi:hypothetical protein
MSRHWWHEGGVEAVLCDRCGEWVRYRKTPPPACPFCMRWRALSLLQPFASAIVRGPKRIENRDRLIFKVPAPMWVAIHASKGWWDIDLSHVWPEFDDLLLFDPDVFVRGALLGVARFVEVRSFAGHPFEPDDAVSGRAEAAFGPWAFGPVCYRIDEVRPLSVHIPCKGAMGLWSVAREHHAALDALVPEAA